MSDSQTPLWHRIRAALQADIDAGTLRAGAQLPNDPALAARFGVNRHTVRRALTEMQRTGLLRVERGRGTFVVEDALTYRLGPTARYTENLIAEGRLASRDLLETAELPAAADIAEALDIARGAPVTRVRVVSRADDRPMMLGSIYFPAERAPGVARAFSGANSVSRALAAVGIAGYRRRWTRIGARMPTADEAASLKIALTVPVLTNRNVDVDPDGRPIKLADAVTRSDLVEFLLES